MFTENIREGIRVVQYGKRKYFLLFLILPFENEI